MADVTVESTTDAKTNELDGLWGPFWTSPSVGYIVYLKGSLDGIVVKKTTDSGASWTEQDSGNNPGSGDIESISVYWDQQTKGDSGTLFHIAFVRSTSDDVHYIKFDTSSDTFGTERVVDSLTVTNTSGLACVSVVKAKSGRVYVAVSGDMDLYVEDTDHSMRSSDDADPFSVENTSRLSPFSSDEEIVRLVPGSATDGDDISAVVYDTINLDLEFWKFDASANTWGKTTIDASISVSQLAARSTPRFFQAASRHSDEDILVVYWNDQDTATADFKSVDIAQATPTVTAKTDLHSNVDDSYYPSILINQQNDDVYAAYLGKDDGSESLNSNSKCYFKKSTDGMTSWGTEQTYGIQQDDVRSSSLGITVGDAGGRVMPVWYNDDLRDLLVNDGNDVEILAATVGITVDWMTNHPAMVPPGPVSVVSYG